MKKNVQELIAGLKGIVEITADDVRVLDENAFRAAIDDLIREACLNTDESVRDMARWIIREGGQSTGTVFASIHDLYMARGTDGWKDMTVPAINVRGYSYEMVRAIYRTALKLKNKAVVLELARSEMGYTMQPPPEYAIVCMAGAVREGYKGPVFVQGDHYQANAKKFATDPAGEIQGLKNLMKESIAAGIFNIDIDSSTLVDLSFPTEAEQQKNNIDVCAELTEYIRGLEPKGVTVSVGGEIGEIGHKNSTVEDLSAFMDGYNARLGKGIVGISKVSVQSGATHGGVVLPDGTVAKVKLDFSVLETLGKLCREKYGIGGVVQHGASTLPDEAFNSFANTQTLEVHLATGFQNLVMDSPNFPADLKKKMYDWLLKNAAGERKEGQTDEQFFYNTRKKAWGPFKQDVMDLPADVQAKLNAELEEKFDFIFRKLNSVNTSELVDRVVKLVRVKAPKPKAGGAAGPDLEFTGDE